MEPALNDYNEEMLSMLIVKALYTIINCLIVMVIMIQKTNLH